MDRNDSQDMISFGDTKTVGSSMVIPERIVLSAGYDGDDNKEEETRRRFRDSTSFDETPLVMPDAVMSGMATPPSILTIDHSEEYFQSRTTDVRSDVSTTPTHRPAHSSGDGEAETPQHYRYSRLQPNSEPGEYEDEDETNRPAPMLDSRMNVVAGREDFGGVLNQQMSTKEQINSAFRRIQILENNLAEQQRDLVWRDWYMFGANLAILAAFAFFAINRKQR